MRSSRPHRRRSRPRRTATGEHVLYVDDDEVMALMADRLLARAGYRVTALRDPAEAIARVRASPHDYDVVVTDFNMPGCLRPRCRRVSCRACAPTCRC